LGGEICCQILQDSVGNFVQAPIGSLHTSGERDGSCLLLVQVAKARAAERPQARSTLIGSSTISTRCILEVELYVGQFLQGWSAGLRLKYVGYFLVQHEPLRLKCAAIDPELLDLLFMTRPGLAQFVNAVLLLLSLICHLG